MARSALRSSASWWPLAALLASGCYGWVPVPPTELPKLDDSVPRPQSGEGSWPVVHDAAGDPVEVIGAFSVEVTTKAGSDDFMSPLRCSVSDGGLRLAEEGGNPKTFPISEIESTKLYRYKSSTSNVVMAVGITAVGLLGLLIGNTLAHAGP